MKRPELFARMAVGLLTLGVVAAPLWLRSAAPLVHARMADNGGWSSSVLHARLGEPLHLRLTSDDVMHGFAVGQTDMPAVDIEPGKVSDVTLSFQKPGTFTFYCTRWCGVNHWRMRGTIEVSGEEAAPAQVSVPLYVKLGQDVDAPHEAPAIPASPPSAPYGQQAADNFDLSALTSVDFYRAHSPYETWQALRRASALSNRSNAQLWDMVAFIWQTNTTAEAVAEGQKLFEQNCAACHGGQGAGNGVFAEALAAAGAGGGANMMVRRPADLSAPKRMLGASPALLQGKILRGGMGTGMPSWGPILDEAETWELIGYIYTFQFKEFSK